MTDTRGRILETARGLFSEQGLHRVAVRDIARALDMSPGNLAYHFATKDQLIAALVLELVSLNERTVFSRMPDKLGLKTLYAMAKRALENMLGYRFILLSPLEAWTAAPELAKLSLSLTKQRRKRHDAMLAALI